MSSRIGAQMFTLREHCKTAKDMARTCQKLSDMGFEAIQSSAGAFNELEAGEIRKILDDTGLKCVATHRPFDALKDIDAAVEYHQTLGCELTAIGGFGGGGKPESEWDAFLPEFSQVAKDLAAKGLRLGYHNHSHELAPFGLEDNPAGIDPKRCPLEKVLGETDPSVWLEIDTYWIAHGGGDPAQWIERCAGRLPAVHIKDMTVTPKREHVMCEVGHGNLNWPRIIEACQNAGVEYYLIERDQGPVDPFESLKISLENLKQMGV